MFSLVNAGSRTADQAGLFHYTTQTNQAKETNSVVDIGFHWVALNGSNQPDDYDGDGLPDYLEDRNGNGVYDTGDLANFNASDTDGDGMSDWQEIQLGTNPNLDESAQSGSRNNYSYDPTGWLRQVSGARGETVGLDPEGNVQQVSP